MALVIVTVVIVAVVIVTVVIVTVVIMTVVIVKFFSKNNFNILSTEENFEGQRFAILAMFFLVSYIKLIPPDVWLTLPPPFVIKNLTNITFSLSPTPFGARHHYIKAPNKLSKKIILQKISLLLLSPLPLSLLLLSLLLLSLLLLSILLLSLLQLSLLLPSLL